MSTTVLSGVVPASTRRAERLFIPAVFITNLGNNIQLIAASLLVFKHSGTALAISWVFIATAVPQIALSSYFGRLVDRFDRRTMSIIADLGSALAAVVLPIWMVIGTAPNWAAYLGTFLLALTAALFVPASTALMTERIRPERLGAFNANYEIASQAGFLFSAAIGGFLVQVLDYRIIFFFNALTFVGSAACWVLMGRRHAEPAQSTQDTDSPGADADSSTPAEPAQRPASRGTILRMSMLYTIGAVVILSVNVILLVLVVHRFKQGAGILGLTDAAAGVGIMGAAWHFKRLKDKVDARLLILAGYAGTGVVDILMPISVYSLIPLILLGGYTFGIARISARTMLMKLIDPGAAGRVFGRINAGGFVLGLVSVFALSETSDHVNVVAAFIALGLWGIVPTAVLVASLRNPEVAGAAIPPARRESVAAPEPAPEPVLEANS